MRDGLGQLRGVYGLGEPLAAGSVIRFGFYITFGNVFRKQDALDAFEGCLYQTGAFNWVEISIQEGYVSTYFLVRAETSTEFGNSPDVVRLIIGQFLACTGLEVKSQDALAIDYIPPQTPSNYQQPRDTHGQQIAPPGQVYRGSSDGFGAADGSKKSDLSGQSFTDWIASSFGVNKSNALLIAGVGGVLGVLVLSKTLKR